MVRIRPQSNHIRSNDSIKHGRNHARGENLTEDLREEVGTGTVKPAGLFVDKERAFHDEELQACDGGEDDHVGDHELFFFGKGVCVCVCVCVCERERKRGDE
jgi:hypothetical protein